MNVVLGRQTILPSSIEAMNTFANGSVGQAARRR
jgi:hypothetical protein